MIDNRLNDAINKMSMDEKYKLMEQLETKNLGYNENKDDDFIESIINLLCDGMYLVAKLFHIV